MRSVLAGIEKRGPAHLPHLRIFARLGSLDKLEQLAGWEGGLAPAVTAAAKLAASELASARVLQRLSARSR